MTTINSEILIRGRTLVQGLRQEGRRDEADTVAVLLRVAERVEQETQYLTTGQVAGRLGISRQTVVNWVKKERLPAIRLGGRLMVPATALAAFARIERILDELDTEREPGAPDEVIELVSRGREGWLWANKAP